MKTIIIIVLAIMVGLVIMGAGAGTFISNVEKGTEKIKQNEQLQEIKNQISSKLNPDGVINDTQKTIEKTFDDIQEKIKERP